MQVSMWLDELGEDSWSMYYFRWACDNLQYFYRRKMDTPRKIEKCKGIDLQETKSITEYVMHMYGF